MASENSTLSGSDASELQCDIRKIREALLIGLESFGEVERIIDRHEMLTKYGDSKPDEALRPLHPTGASDTVGVFACALRLLENMEPAHV